MAAAAEKPIAAQTGKYSCRHKGCSKCFAKQQELQAHVWGAPFSGRSRGTGLRENYAVGGHHKCFDVCCRFLSAGPYQDQSASDYLAQQQGAPAAVDIPPLRLTVHLVLNQPCANPDGHIGDIPLAGTEHPGCYLEWFGSGCISPACAGSGACSVRTLNDTQWRPLITLPP